MRGKVVEKLESLHGQLMEARASHEASSRGLAASQRSLDEPVEEDEEDEEDEEGAETEAEEEIDLSPTLKAALDKLWQRPYDCRIFTLQLLQSLAQLDDRSLCMMSSCFARSLENHPVPVADGEPQL